MLETQLRAIGVLLIGLALLHAAFPRYFGWRRELAAISLLSRQIQYVHTFFVALVVLGMGLLCFTSASDLTSTPLGHRVALVLAIFWGCRLLVQFFGYSSELWRGKRFETAVHVVFATLWAYLTVVFGLVAAQ